MPIPKVIDFGIAKATEGRLTDATVYTQLHQFIGTPAYMSPEQAEMSGLDIDTRSDIYSLGVLLYELLAGSTPFDAQELAASGLDGMRRTIREKEPVRPSTRLAALKGEELTTTAKRRSAETGKLLHQLKGDLDWIVMKCLEKDRTRRYDTANGLADDINRHLQNEPVLAHPPSAAYRLQTLMRRNKVAFAVGTAVAGALLLGIIVSAWQAVRAGRAEALALQTRGDAEKLSNFILDDFYAALEPSGQYEMVAPLTRQAVAYYDSLPVSLRTSDTARNRASAQARLALVTALQGDFKTAMPAAEQAAATLDQMRQHGDQSDGTIYALGRALLAQAESDWDRGGIRAAIGPTQKGVDILRPYVQSADGSRRIKLEYAHLLNALSHSQPAEQGVATCEEALRILAGLGALDLADLSATSAWANIADTEAREGMTVGRVDEAERLEKQVQKLAEGVLNRRPADLQARKDLIWAPDELALAEARRFHDEAAMQFAAQSQRAAQDYLRFNPSDPEGSVGLEWADCSICNLLFRTGRPADAMENARIALQHDCDSRSRAVNVWIMAEFGLVMSRWQAQCGQRDAAVQALQQAGNFYAASVAKTGVLEMNDVWAESVEASSRQTGLAFGEDASVYAMSTTALPRLDLLIAGLTDPDLRATALYWKRQTLEEAARAALNLQRFAEAETAARALLSLHGETGVASEHMFLDQPEDADWGRVLLAQAATAQGRKAEALQTLEPALSHYRDAQAKGAAHVTFRQHFARALYAEALAELTDNGGTTRSREALGRAVGLLQGLTEEARQLHDSKELLSWIAAAQKKLNPDAQAKK